MSKNDLLHTNSGEDTSDFDGDDGLDLTSHPHQMDTDTEVRIAKEQSSVYELLRRESRGNLVLAPDFQRNDVWDLQKQSELIESMLMGIPIPLIYLFEDENGIRQIIDGKQRVSALKNFLSDSFALSELTMFPHLKGQRFSQIPKLLQAKLEDFQLHAYVIQPPTPEYVKFNIFERVNRAGTSLNKQEMRHALYQGTATYLIAELAESQAFIQATGGSVRPDRMRDRYLVLRFVAFYLLMKNEMPMVEYRSDMDLFLAMTMRFLNVKASHELILQTRDASLRGMINAYLLADDTVFRFDAKKGHKRRPVNMGLFETLVYALSEVDAAKLRKDVDYAGMIHTFKDELEAAGGFNSSIDTYDSVNIRFELAVEFTKRLQRADED